MAKIEKNTAGKDQNAMDRLTNYYEANKKRINTIVTVILLVVVGGYAYLQLYRAPRVEKAATNIAWAQRMFEMDSLDLALNGDAGNPGFLKIEKKYSGTPTANLANYYIGVSYLHKGEFDKAIKYLKDFDGKGSMLAYTAWGALGDAYMEKGDIKNGIDYYEKAAGNKKDEVLTPIYLYRAAVAYEMNKQEDKAAKAYQTIRDEYPRSTQAQDINRKLARLGVLE